MKKLILGLFILVITSFVTTHAQVHRKKVQKKKYTYHNNKNTHKKKKKHLNLQKNNHRMSTFHGHQNDFHKDKRYNYFGITLNSFNYFGELSPYSNKGSLDLGLTKPGIGLLLGHRYGPRYTFRAEFRYGVLSGSDFKSANPNSNESVGRYVRNLHFRNRIKELTLTTVFDLFKNASTFRNRVPITPYAFLGFMVFHHEPEAFVGSDAPSNQLTWVKLRPLGTEGQNLTLPDGSVNKGIKPYKNIEVGIPFGIGVRYKYSNLIDISYEIGMRFLFTDYIDDISGGYVDNALLQSQDPLAAYLSDRSTEFVDAESGEQRFNSDIETIGNAIFNNRLPDGSIAGYGKDDQTNRRGNSEYDDFYLINTVRISFVLEKGAKKQSKFR